MSRELICDAKRMDGTSVSQNKPRAKFLEHIAHISNEKVQSRQLIQFSGIGLTTASAIVVTVGKGHGGSPADEII